MPITMIVVRLNFMHSNNHNYANEHRNHSDIAAYTNAIPKLINLFQQQKGWALKTYLVTRVVP